MMGLTLQESKNTTVNGMPALATICKQVNQDQTTGQQQVIMILSYYINYNNTFYVFHGLSVEADFNAFLPLLESTMQNFSRLTDPSKLNVKPKKILVRKVQRSGTLASAFSYYGVKQDQMNELALLNNMELTDKVQVGKMIKIIGE